MLTGGVLAAAALAQSDSLELGLARILEAGDEVGRDRAAEELLAAEPDFVALYEALERGTVQYSAVPRGVVRGEIVTDDGTVRNFAFVVPDDYDPARRTPVRFMLHGGVGTSDRQAGERGPVDNLRRLSEITVLPSAWREDPWWSPGQVENLNAILLHLKGLYNVDENRVVLAGVSDGAAGTWYAAMLDPTPWAAFLPIIGSFRVLGSVASESPLFLLNLRNKPFLTINTTEDPLYSSLRVEADHEWLRTNGVELRHRAVEGYGHNTSWWGSERSLIEGFVAEHPRQPHPEEIHWAVSSALGHNRAHWLIVAPADGAKGSVPAAEWNRLQGSDVFRLPVQWGQVSASRDDNEVELLSQGVEGVTLLLSPAIFDFDRPLRIVVNGHEVFNADVRRSPRVLLERWLADQDRTMLYGAEIEIALSNGRWTAKGGDPGG